MLALWLGYIGRYLVDKRRKEECSRQRQMQSKELCLVWWPVELKEDQGHRRRPWWNTWKTTQLQKNAWGFNHTATLSSELWKTFAGCNIIILVFRKSPSGYRMGKRKEGSQHGSTDIRWASFTVEVKGDLALLRVVLKMGMREKAKALGGRSKEIWIGCVGWGVVKMTSRFLVCAAGEIVGQNTASIVVLICVPCHISTCLTFSNLCVLCPSPSDLNNELAGLSRYQDQVSW